MRDWLLARAEDMYIGSDFLMDVARRGNTTARGYCESREKSLSPLHVACQWRMKLAAVTRDPWR